MLTHSALISNDFCCLCEQPKVYFWTSWKKWVSSRHVLLLSVLLGRAITKCIMTIQPSVNEIDLIERLDRIQKYLVRYESKLFQLMDDLDNSEDLEPKTRALENVMNWKFYQR